MLSTHTIAQRLPDLPRWVEVRDLLSAGRCELFGLQDQPELAVVVRDPIAGDIFVIGKPSIAAVDAALKKNVHAGIIIAPPEQATWLADALPNWIYAPAILHLLQNPERLPHPSLGNVGFLDPVTLPRLPIPADLRSELQSAAECTLISAAFVDHQPVAFCYAGATTESLWDVSVDTLAPHRRHGYAALCAAHMIRHMQTQGKQPVWDALASNPASWRLALKLGFVPVDELALFEPPPAPSAAPTGCLIEPE
ncbi:MAG: hypothetical protein NVS2B7_18130 [Herpetosiphon sp.]